MFDAAERLVVCNERYLKMYDLSPAIVKPGAALIDVIRHRFEDPEASRATRRNTASKSGPRWRGAKR